MTIEIGGPSDICGIPFTIVFAKSQNLTDWEMLPPETYSYTKDRYSACPVIRYADGFYFIIYLESLPCHRWVPYIVRTQDFLEFELGLRNPVMFFDDNDKKVQHPDKFSQEELEYINGAIDCNNSDIDLCEFNGKTVILYSWGNQYGKEFLAEAEYDGSMEEFLKSFF
jgi:alpha-L-fucosidase